jgi:hypothetical protein
MFEEPPRSIKNQDTLHSAANHRLYLKILSVNLLIQDPRLVQKVHLPYFPLLKLFLFLI